MNDSAQDKGWEAQIPQLKQVPCLKMEERTEKVSVAFTRSNLERYGTYAGLKVLPLPYDAGFIRLQSESAAV